MGGPQKNSIFFEASLYGLIALTSVLMMAAARSQDYAAILATSGTILLLGVYALYVLSQNKHFAVSTPGQLIGVMVFAGILTRLALAAGIYGYITDIDCFVGWSQIAYGGGLDHFYTSGYFADYPPLYMYVLYFLGLLQSVFSIQANVLLIKLPAIACDIVLALLIYRAARQKLDNTQAIFVFACLIINAALIVNSAAWGQIDILFVLLALICIYLLMKEKYAPAVVVFVLAFLLKVQAVLIGPVFLYVLARGLYKRSSLKKTLAGFLLGIAAGTGIGLLLILPFTGGRPLTWIIDLYLNSLGGYSNVAINAFNLYGLLGLNWAPLATTFLGLPFNAWGYMAIAAVCGYAAWLYRLDPRGANLFNIAAFITLGVYMFAHSMHERYSFAAPIFLLMAFIFMKDKRLFYASMLNSGAVLINQCVAFAYYNQWIPYDLMAWVSVLNLVSFIYAAVVITKNASYYHKNKRLVANEEQKNPA
jgi:Gpi18-like mannosyltransferase